MIETITERSPHIVAPSTVFEPAAIRSAEGGRALTRLTGLAAVASAATFLPGAAIQQATGWFPLEVLSSGTIETWLVAMEGVRATAVFGVSLSLVGIVCFGIAGVGLCRILRDSDVLSTLGLAGYLLGVPVAFVAFLMGLVVTWEIVPTYATNEAATASAAVLMRTMLAGDDLATLLIIGLGNGSFALAAYRAGWLPTWLMVLGLTAPALWALYLLGYFIPPLQAGVIGAPLGLLWFLGTGIVLMRRPVVERPSAA